MTHDPHLTPSETMRANSRWHGLIKDILLNEAEPGHNDTAISSDREQSAYLPYLMTALTLVVVEHFSGERPGQDQISKFVDELRVFEHDAGREFNSAEAKAIIHAAINETDLTQLFTSEADAIAAGHHVLWSLSAATPGIKADVGRLMGDIDEAYQVAVANTPSG